MSAHDHRVRVDGCERCDLSADEMAPIHLSAEQGWALICDQLGIDPALVEPVTLTGADGKRHLTMRVTAATGSQWPCITNRRANRT